MKNLHFIFFLLFGTNLIAQDIAWQQTLGGAREEHLYDG